MQMGMKGFGHIFFLVLLCFTSCSTSAPPKRVSQHAIIVDKTGGVRIADGRNTPLPRAIISPNAYFAHVITNALQSSPVTNGKKQILIFVHGGLNEKGDSLKRVERLTDCAATNCIPPDLFYPIFINWDSGFASSYVQQLLYVQQGRVQTGWYKWVGASLAPFYLIKDAGVATVRYPVVLAQQMGSDFRTIPWRIRRFRTDDEKLMQERFRQFREAYLQTQTDPIHRNDPVFSISMGNNQLSFWDTAKTFYNYVFLLPVRLTTAWVVDAGGNAAWVNMSRRVQTMFRRPTEYLPGYRQATPESTGGVALFMEALSSALAKAPEHYEITLVGHSMGTMILNEIIQRYGSTLSTNVVFKDIVYMAAACSVRDFEEAVIPYLENNPQTHFYNLSLHPLAEKREEAAYKYAPRGTLLEWIDNFLSTPRSVPDRTLGKWENIMATAHAIPEPVRRQISLKAFSMEGHNDPGTPFGHPGEKPIDGGDTHFPEGNPQRHSDFSTNQFWQTQFWVTK